MSQSVGSQNSDNTTGDRALGNWCPLSPDTMKRAAAKKLIERYFYQLVDGCGDPNCSNEYCASSGKVKNLTPNQAAAQAFQLFSQEAKLCEAHPSKVPRTQGKPLDTACCNELDSHSKAVEHCNDAVPSNSGAHGKAMGKQCETGTLKEKAPPFLTEQKLLNIIKTCEVEDSYCQLIRAIGEVYSNPESLAQSFLRTEPESPIEVMLEKAGVKDLKRLKKEDVRTLEGDLDKDEDCRELELEKEKQLTLPYVLQLGENSNSRTAMKRSKLVDTSVDVASLRRAYSHLFKLPLKIFEGALVNAIVTLTGNLEIQLKLLGSSNKKKTEDEDLLNIFVIITEIPILGSSEFIDVALPHICKVAAHLSVPCQAKLAKVWARHCKGRLKSLLESLQQLITLKVITGSFTRDYCIQDEEAITSPTKLMKILYYANILAGEMDAPDLRFEDPTLNAGDDSLLGGETKTPKSPPPVDPLESQLQISVLDSRKPLIPFHEFYNEPLSDAVEMDKDFAYYKSDFSNALDFVKTKKFSFMYYSFILTPATKTLGLCYDNRIRMYSERRMSFFQTAVGQPTNPYLKLKVRRDHIIDDALVELEMVAMENPKDLKKQLVVEFEGEQGIDEGGVSKEFFQLIVEEIFNPDYGMFVYQQETETVWFNPTSFESDAQFTLIGIVLGLAIYNNIILDVRFPMVVYKKLMGKRGTFYDVQDWNPTLFSGLKELLEYEDDDIEDVLIQTFRVCYTDVFGNTLFHELKEGGDQVYVNQDNKKEFVDLYSDFLLNKCIEKQFRAFRKGFQMVTDESPLVFLFRPEEVEQLVCGSKNFDFNELEEATEYDGGYTAETPIIKHFWGLVHAMSLDDKRKLLQFATGSDRVPVGGLSRLKMVIAKNGPDSDRLPTAHTCFNVLLLPEYSSREKLQDRLEKAINYSKGFGML
ncbi:hypothetical protein RUM44_007593 [Polyplax serrata]|uniref:HECT-type E3 ubiquitin transferase n=1 Tax=Polyplax serrata TaxID=468196 RepID=A0ABR1B7X5_POLSC